MCSIISRHYFIYSGENNQFKSELIPPMAGGGEYFSFNKNYIREVSSI